MFILRASLPANVCGGGGGGEGASGSWRMALFKQMWLGYCSLFQKL